MHILKCLAAPAALFLAAVPGLASAQGIMIEGNGARAQGHWGGELGAGYNFKTGPFTLRPIAGLFFHSDKDDRYRRESKDICRDRSTGQFADKSDCDGRATKLYGKVEATVTLPAMAEIGAGARLSGDRARIYGTAAVDLLPVLKIKGNIGGRYASLGLMAQF